MRIGFLTHCLPLPETSGGASTCWAILHALKEAGHDVVVFYLEEPFSAPENPERLRLLEPLTEQVVTLRIPSPSPWPDWERASLWSRAMRFVRDECWKPPFALLFPSHLLRETLQEALDNLCLDTLFVYHWIAAAAVHGVHVAPKMIVTGDLYHRPTWCRWQQATPKFSMAYMKQTIFALRDRYHYVKQMAALLHDGDIIGSFGAYDAQWLRRHGEPRSRYFRTPLLDSAGPSWRDRRKSSERSGALPKIITAISNLQATSTRLMVEFFATQIFPILERELGRDGFEVHVIGRGQPPPALARLLPHPAIRLRGYVDSIDSEFLTADVVLIPTPIFLGFRVRILTAFAFGNCVVAHANEAINVPEIVHERNALLARTGEGLAKATLRALGDRVLRERLGEEARRTYEQHFSPKAALPIVETLEHLAGTRMLEWSAVG